MNEELEKNIRDAYLRGVVNKSAVEKLVALASRFMASSNEWIETIGANADKLGDFDEKFQVEGTNETSRYDKVTKSLQLCSSDDPMLVDYAFGEAVFDLGSSSWLIDDVKQLLQDTRTNCISSSNIDDFSSYLEGLCDINNENRTKFELGPVSDIICSLLQYPVLTINGTKLTLPSKAKKPMYYDLENGGVDIAKVYRENVVNYMVLAANNRTVELDVLREFLGEAWVADMEEALAKIAKNVKRANLYSETELNQGIGKK